MLVCYYLKDGNRKRRVYVPLPEDLKEKVNAINARFLKGAIAENEVKTLLETLVQMQYRKFEVQARAVRDARLSEINNKAFDAYWAGHYALKTKTKDKSSPRHDIKKALSLIEPLSVFTAEKHELEEAVIKNAGSPAKAARAIARLNEMLRWMERKNSAGGRLKLEAPEVPKKKIQFCRADELEKIVGYIEDENLKLFSYVIFGSGLRVGEALALDSDSFAKGIITVEYQLDKKGNLVPPKKGSAGQVVVIPGYEQYIARWIEIEDKVKYRYSLYDALYEATRKAFPKGPTRVLVGPHDIRHGHAVHLLESGVPMTQVAQNLRNDIKVCTKYYTGFGHTEGTVEMLKKMLSK